MAVMSDDRPTLEDVARIAGVSRATVSRVVNGVRNVDAAVQEVVQRVIRQIGYVPNHAARSLVTRRTGAVALIVSGAGDVGSAHVFGDPFFGRVVGGIVEFLRQSETHPLLMFADTEQSRAEAVTHLRQGGADGALLVSTLAEDPLPGMCVRAGLPAVLFARPSPPIPISYVDLDHRAGAELAARHLLARGCERLATISGPLDVPASRDRLAGFRDELARHGHAYVPNEIGGFTHETGAAAMTRLLTAHPDVDGVFVANDLMAQAGLGVLHRTGRRVPDDVALVGFDDSAPARSAHPPITTIRQPVEDMGAEMACLLRAHMADPTRRPTSVIFDPTLVVRESA